MPKLITIFSLAMLLATTTLGQNYTMLSVRAGAGLTTNTFGDVNIQQNGQSASVRYSSVPAFMAGVGLNLPLSGRLSVQPEITYTQRGYALRLVEPGGSRDDSYRINTIELPVLLKVVFAKDRFRFFSFVGPAVAYMLDGTVDQTLETKTTRTTQSGKLIFSGTKPATGLYFDTNTFRQFDLSVQGGLAAGTRIGTGLLLLEIRGGLGLLNFNQTTPSRFMTGFVTLSYGIPLGSLDSNN